MKEFSIMNKKIGNDYPIFLIAEAGINHNGIISLAKKLVDLAVKAECNAIKFQTFITEDLLLTETPKAEYQKSKREESETFYEMIKKYELSQEDFRELNKYCREKGIIFLSTPFDEISVNFLAELNVPAFKIGSGDMNNFPLLELICSYKKPILLSTGMSTLDEVKETVEFVRSNNISDIAIFQCTTNYPTSLEEINLNVIDLYKQEFPFALIGFSDHSLGMEASIGAAAKGVKIIEKHITLDKNMEGPDHSASLGPDELFNWVKSVRNIEKALGTKKKVPTESEKEIAKIARKSIVTIKDLKEGEILTDEHISIKRPGSGIPPKYFKTILGKKILKDISKNSIISWEDIE